MRLSFVDDYSFFHPFQKYMNMGFLESLVVSMTQREPGKRPTAVEALKMFNDIIEQQPWYKLRWRLIEKKSGPATRFFQDVGTISRESAYWARTCLGKLFG